MTDIVQKAMIEQRIDPFPSNMYLTIIKSGYIAGKANSFLEECDEASI